MRPLMFVLDFGRKEFRLGADRRRGRRSTGSVGDASLGQTPYRLKPAWPTPPQCISRRNRGFLLTVYKRACILPPEYLEERCDQA
jgi:hypothetical protein